MKIRTKDKARRPAPAGAGQFLRTVPHVNNTVTVTPKGSGGALVEIPLDRPRYLVPPISWLLPFSGKRRLELDAVGASVLDLCNARRTVENIIEKFAADHKLSFREAQLPVTQFFRQLTRRGVLVLVGHDEDGNDS